jgi:hypothetical protein
VADDANAWLSKPASKPTYRKYTTMRTNLSSPDVVHVEAPDGRNLQTHWVSTVLPVAPERSERRCALSAATLERIGVVMTMITTLTAITAAERFCD